MAELAQSVSHATIRRCANPSSDKRVVRSINKDTKTESIASFKRHLEGKGMSPGEIASDSTNSEDDPWDSYYCSED